MAQSAAQPPAQQLGVSIARGVREGLDRIEIQLHPAELGRVDVRMELGHDGRITAVVSAERSDTLEQLRRDIDQLERALADPGSKRTGRASVSRTATAIPLAMAMTAPKTEQEKRQGCPHNWLQPHAHFISTASVSTFRSRRQFWIFQRLVCRPFRTTPARSQARSCRVTSTPFLSC